MFKRIYFASIGWIGWILIQILARTWRWEIHGFHNFQALEQQKRPIIYAFWHGRILPATFFWRNRGIVVLTSENKDGEYIAHVIRRFGYGSSRGSTSKGAIKGTIGLIRTIKHGSPVAFTVDGPRGPRHRVQQGVTWLAGYAQTPILPFHIEARRAKKLSSWDGFQIPLFFSKVRIDIAPAMNLEKNLNEEQLETMRILLQDTLNRLREEGEKWAQHV